jgi:tetraacyldisaccharide 4'-kinase
MTAYPFSDAARLSAISHALIPVSWLYGAAAELRRAFHERRARRLPCPVVSIGNITCGGTGKTPTVEMVVRDLLERGRRPAILSRGYKARASIGASIGPEAGHWNDEYQVLATNLPDVPHYQGSDRCRWGEEALRRGADVLVLDDGFQHVRLERDLDIVLIDALSPFGGGRVLPAGLLREPLRVLEKVDLFGISRSDQVPPRFLDSLDTYLRNRFRGIPRIHLRSEAVGVDRIAEVSRPPEPSGPLEPPETLRDRRVLAFCGVGNPEAFRRQLLALGVRIEGFLRFRDHHAYGPEDIHRIHAQAAALGAEVVLMTQKDAVKIPPEERTAAWRYLRIAQRIDRGLDAYRSALDALLR